MHLFSSQKGLFGCHLDCSLGLISKLKCPHTQTWSWGKYVKEMIVGHYMAYTETWPQWLAMHVEHSNTRVRMLLGQAKDIWLFLAGNLSPSKWICWDSSPWQHHLFSFSRAVTGVHTSASNSSYIHKQRKEFTWRIEHGTSGITCKSPYHQVTRPKSLHTIKCKYPGTLKMDCCENNWPLH